MSDRFKSLKSFSESTISWGVKIILEQNFQLRMKYQLFEMLVIIRQWKNELNLLYVNDNDERTMTSFHGP